MFTIDSDVKEIARMQALIDSYESFILALSWMTKGKGLDYALFTDTPLDKCMSRIWKWVKSRSDIVKENDNND